MQKKKIKKRKIESYQWKVVPCFVGEDCWCRAIKTVPERGRPRTFISGSWITKNQAEIIVKIHNEWLELKGKDNE